MAAKHIILLVHGIRTHASWYERAEQVFAQLDNVEIRPIKYGRFDLFRFLVPGPWRRTPVDKSEDRILPIIDRSRAEQGQVSVIAHSNGTNVVATLLKESHLFRIDNLILCGSVVDSDFDWEGVSHKVGGTIINDYGVRDIWPAVAKAFTWGYGYSGTNGFGSPVRDRLHDAGHSDYFTKEFMEKYWISFFRDGTIVRPAYGDVEIPKSPWWFFLFEIPWKWLILAALGYLAFWSLGGMAMIRPPAGQTEVAAPPATAPPATADRDATAAATPDTPTVAADDEPAENDEIAAFSPECDQSPERWAPTDIAQAKSDAAFVNTATWLNIAIGELGQREAPGAAANPRIVAYMATAEPKYVNDEQPWNSQFVNYVMRKAGKRGTNSGRAQSWLAWGKDAIAEVGEPVLGSIVVAKRAGVPDGGFAGFYLGSNGAGAVRMLAGNVCREVAVVTVPESKIMGYRLPSGWLGPAQ
ncbi:TIGR02594 family protein [Sphingopyxis sp. KK2]|uniref:TIGR02594 family protein n=1 Tax=Sphingopyxis sp. KK2 TaxID=1855727 RepID=UPI00097E60FB|nr:TIGR02594 family protein [Sphingopyxis sp. KK2]